MTAIAPKPLVAYRPGTLAAEGERHLRARYAVVSIDDPQAATARALVTDGGQGADKALIAALPALEVIAVCAVGVDAVDVHYAAERGIAVTNTPDVLTDDVADLAIALIIATARRLPAADRFIREGRWAAGERFPNGRQASRRSLGILGLGRIGRRIAERAAPMMRDISYHSRHVVSDVPWRYLPDVASLAAAVDILVVATPATPKTRKLVDRAILDALGPDGMLINIARGSVVDEQALISALEEGRLGSAGLDVFADEPNVPAALIASDKVVLFPHIGSSTKETCAAMDDLVLANLSAFFEGLPLPTPVPAAEA